MKRFLFFLICFFIGGCAAKEDVELLQQQLINLSYTQTQIKKEFSKELQRVKKEIDKKLSSSNFSVRVNQADLASKLEGLRIKIASLEGNYDLLKREIEGEKNATTEIENRLEHIEKEIKKLNNDIDMLRHVLGLSKKESGKNSKKFKVTKTEGKNHKPKKSNKQDYEINPKKLYNQALKNFHKRHYYAASHLFSLFIKKFPHHNLIPNAYFWKGECYFKLGQYAKAILNYQVVLDKYKTSNKYPSCLLKEGISFYKLGKTKAGGILLDELIKNFPDSKETKIAKKFLKENKGKF